MLSKAPTTTSMVAASVLQQHIPIMAGERLQPIMTFMVITSDQAAIGNVTEFHSWNQTIEFKPCGNLKIEAKRSPLPRLFFLKVFFQLSITFRFNPFNISSLYKVILLKYLSLPSRIDNFVCSPTMHPPSDPYDLWDWK